jgi:hypothetical protein
MIRSSHDLQPRFHKELVTPLKQPPTYDMIDWFPFPLVVYSKAVYVYDWYASQFNQKTDLMEVV